MAPRLLFLAVMPSAIDSPRGFSLVEVLIAATTLLIALSALAQLLTSSAATVRRARATTAAAVVAQQKLEALLPAATLGAVSASPPEALNQCTDGYCDFVDASGAAVGTGTTLPSSAAFIRRWAVEPIGGDLALALSVVVTDAHAGGVEARVATIARRLP